MVASFIALKLSNVHACIHSVFHQAPVSININGGKWIFCYCINWHPFTLAQCSVHNYFTIFFLSIRWIPKTGTYRKFVPRIILCYAEKFRIFSLFPSFSPVIRVSKLYFGAKSNFSTLDMKAFRIGNSEILNAELKSFRSMFFISFIFFSNSGTKKFLRAGNVSIVPFWNSHRVFGTMIVQYACACAVHPVNTTVLTADWTISWNSRC